MRTRPDCIRSDCPVRDSMSADRQTSHFNGSLSSPHPNLNRFLLPNGEHVSCVFWNGLYHITGTDIGEVDALLKLTKQCELLSSGSKRSHDLYAISKSSTKAQRAGQKADLVRFEEGVFSDLRNLKPGTDACLEEPKWVATHSSFM